MLFGVPAVPGWGGEAYDAIQEDIRMDYQKGANELAIGECIF